MRVALSAAATREFETAVEWWRANRPLAPTLLEDEMSAVLERLAVAPLMGRPVLNRRLSGLRRVSLEGARYQPVLPPPGETQPRLGGAAVAHESPAAAVTLKGLASAALWTEGPHACPSGPAPLST